MVASIVRGPLIGRRLMRVLDAERAPDADYLHAHGPRSIQRLLSRE
jgi:hypothetical protein